MRTPQATRSERRDLCGPLTGGHRRIKRDAPSYKLHTFGLARWRYT